MKEYLVDNGKGLQKSISWTLDTYCAVPALMNSRHSKLPSPLSPALQIQQNYFDPVNEAAV